MRMARHTIVRRSPHAKPAVSARRGTPAASTSGDHPSVLPSVKKHHTLEELAYLDIRQAIAEGRFAPGERIVVSTLAAASGVSRIPVMQALRRLETEGFVRITPHNDLPRAVKAIEAHRLGAMQRLAATT